MQLAHKIKEIEPFGCKREEKKVIRGKRILTTVLEGTVKEGRKEKEQIIDDRC